MFSLNNGLPAKILKLLLFLLLLPLQSLAQAEKDVQKPFGQGQVVLTPAGLDYLDDLSHDISIEDIPEATHTVLGWLSPQVGWMDSLGQGLIGLRAITPGVLFDEIPYLLDPGRLFGWIPSIGTLEALNFPAQAWWGPNAAAGSIQFHPPDTPGEAQGNFAGWLGTNGMGGGWGRFFNPFLGLTASLRQSSGNPSVSPATGGLELANIKFLQSDYWNLSASFLGAQSASNDYWYVATGTVNWDNGNFQSIQLKPFFQAAQSGAVTAREGGGYLNYKVNLGGIAQTHLRVGESYVSTQGGGLSNGYSKGFVQNGELLDVLGFFTLDAAFRWDYSAVSPTIFSSLIGAQANQGDFIFFGDFGSADAATGSGVNQADAGVRYSPQDNFALTAGYLHNGIAGNTYDGGRMKLQWELSSFLNLFRRLGIEGEGRVLNGNALSGPADLGGAIHLDISKEGGFFLKGRVFSSRPLYMEAGGSLSPFPALRVFASWMNISGQPVSWPDPDTPLGSVFWGGVEGVF